MTIERPLTDAFHTLNDPAVPDPQFSARLRNELLGTSRPSSLRLFDVSSQPANISEDHHRGWGHWFSLIAAAVLVLGVALGGYRVLRYDESNSPGPLVLSDVPVTPAAQTNPPADQEPVMARSSGGEERIFHGPAPVIGEYTRLWEADVKPGDTVFFGDYLYHQPYGQDGGEDVAFTAFDASTGAQLWTRDVVPQLPFAAMNAGVVVGIVMSDTTFQIALLDHRTGEPIWTSEQGYQIAVDGFMSLITIVDDVILFNEQSTNVIALDDQTGTELWRYATTATCEIGLCPGLSIAARADSLYILDRFASTIQVINPSDGSSRWSVPFADPAPDTSQRSSSIEPVVLSSGLLVQSLIFTPDATSQRLDMYSATDGELLWSIEDPNGPAQIVQTDTELYIQVMAGDQSTQAWELKQIDIVTGETMRTIPQADPIVLGNAAYLADANVLISGYRTYFDETNWAEENLPIIGGIFGDDDFTAELTLIDPVTLDATGTVEIENCIVNLPLSYDGKVLCFNPNTTKIMVYTARSTP